MRNTLPPLASNDLLYGADVKGGAFKAKHPERAIDLRRLLVVRDWRRQVPSFAIQSLPDGQPFVRSSNAKQAADRRRPRKSHIRPGLQARRSPQWDPSRATEFA